MAARLYDPGLGADETERALRARVGTSERFACLRADDDGSLRLNRVDFVCTAVDGWPMYAVATSGDEITAVEQFGGP